VAGDRPTLVDGARRWTFEQAVEGAQRFCADNAQWMRFASVSKIPMPFFAPGASRALGNLIRRALADDDSRRLRGFFEEARAVGVRLDATTLKEMGDRIARLIHDACATPAALAPLTSLEEYVDLLTSVEVDGLLWSTQNRLHGVARFTYPKMSQYAELGDETAKAWCARFRAIGKKACLRISG